jgi:hypothetical protein
LGAVDEDVLTIATTRTNEFDIGQIVLMAYRKAGLLNEHQSLTTAKTNAGKALLETIVKELEIYGVAARWGVLERVTVTAGVNTLSLDATTLDVRASAVWIDGDDPDPDNPTTVLPMTSVDEERRQVISSAAAEGQPTLFYVDKTTVPISVWIWPTPISNGFIRFQSRRLAADNLDTTKTPDLERYWAQYLIHELGAQLAMDNSMLEKAVALDAIAQRKLTMCRAYSNPRGSFQIGLDHATGWSR